MLNLFAAAGHVQYAKSATLYLQIIRALPVTHPWLYEQFAVHGCHAVRRSRHWAGLSTDLITEQVLMKAIKGRGGLTHGSGMTENARLSWVHTMHQSTAVHRAMTALTKLETEKRTEHRDMDRARTVRD